MTTMTQSEVDALPMKTSRQGAYEHIKEKFTCPECGTRLEPSRNSYSTTDDILRDGPIETTAVFAAGCGKCGVLYRFEENPITFKRK